MSIAQSRRERASKKANFYKNLAVGTGFVILGNLSGYPALFHGCLVFLMISVIAINTPLIATILANFAKADRLRKDKVQQQLWVLTAAVAIYIIMFILGRLI